VQGQTFQPPIVNGIDDVSYSTVRFQWTSDAAAHPINLNRIVYATAAQWAIKPRVYPQRFIADRVNVNSNTTIQGNVVSNLLANTTYHIAGQSSTDDGRTWCPAVDETFTTLPFTGVIKPVPPQTFSLTEPTVTGTDYTVGRAPCTTLQVCLNIAEPGDGIGIPPDKPAVVISGTPLTFPVPKGSIPVESNAGTSTFTAAAHGLKNGTLIHLGSAYYVPSPINPGVTYSVVNATANTFQISQDGLNPLSLRDNGIGSIYVIPWPLKQSYVVIHSTASPANLPPAGVRLDPVAYGTYLAVIQLASPAVNMASFGFTAYYWFRNIEFTIAPNAPTTEIDPTPTGEIFQTSPLSDHIVFDQCWFHPAPGPDRIENAAIWGGTNQAIMNSHIDNVDFWKPVRQGQGTKVGRNSVVVQPMTYSWVGQGNVKQTCSLTNPATLALSGSNELGFYLYWTINPCRLTANVQTGLVASGPDFNIVTSAAPEYPVDASRNSTVLQIGRGTFYGSKIGFEDAGITGNSRWVSESASGVQMGDGPGPFMFLNNYFAGEGIIGVFKDEFVGNACGGAPTPCPYVYNSIDLTVQRNTITWDPAYISTSAAWNGSWWFGRNAFELKQGSRARFDGNRIGPVYAGLANGECQDLFTYYGSNDTAKVNSQKTSDIEWSNNTCFNAGSAITAGGGGFGTTPGNSMQRIWIHNNFFENINGYAASPAPRVSLAQGRGLGFSDVESVTVEHNSFYRQGGNGSYNVSLAVVLSGGMTIKDNIFSYSTEAPASGFVFNSSGGPTPSPAPASGTQGTALLRYLNNVTWTNNVMVGAWSNSDPSSYTELTQSQIDAATALYPRAPDTIFPRGSTLADREASANASGAGVIMDQLEVAQGAVKNVHASPMGATSADIAFRAPDPAGCTLDYGTVNFPSGTGSWTRVPNVGGQRDQTVSLSGLTPATTYIFRVNCAVSQPIGTFTTP
jgi:hypothetical protein